MMKIGSNLYFTGKGFTFTSLFKSYVSKNLNYDVKNSSVGINLLWSLNSE